MDSATLAKYAEELEKLLRAKVRSPIKVGWMRDEDNNAQFMVYGDLGDCLNHIPERWYGWPVMFQANSEPTGGIFLAGQLGQ